MSNFDLSYLVCTRNRLSFLRIILPRVLENRLPGEEIVIVDGNSTDGSREYLQQLFDENKIDQFISEPDRNQAHGWNKAFLMARGTILKKLIDDDVHDITAIRKCLNFMLLHPDTDICISNCLEANLSTPASTKKISRLSFFNNWKAGHTKTFTFSDVSMLIRRSALSYLGLYDTQFKMLDWEYSLRCTYLNAKIAYFTGYNSISITTPGNVTSTQTKKQLQYEGMLGKTKYGYPGDEYYISTYSRIKIWIGWTRYRLAGKHKLNHDQEIPADSELKKIYTDYYRRLEEVNKMDSYEFIY